MDTAMKAFNLTADENIRIVDALASLGKDFDKGPHPHPETA